jgi:hypothetical protein
VLALAAGLTIMAAPNAAAATGELSIWEHYWPGQGALFERKYTPWDCDSAGYSWPSTQPLYSSSVSYVASSTTRHCNAVRLRSLAGNTYNYCVNSSNYIINFPAGLNDRLSQFGVYYSAGCRLF